MQSKLIKNYHVENVVLGKDFNLGATSSFFHVFTLKHIEMFNLVLNKEKMVPNSSNYNIWNIYWPPNVNIVIIFLQRD
jgi:hypothetical protein